MGKVTNVGLIVFHISITTASTIVGNIFHDCGYCADHRVISKMSAQIYQCLYCGRNNFASAKGLSQHQRQKQACFTKMKQKYNVDRGYVTAI